MTEESRHRAGFVALLGEPNAGKSTLLNRLLGERLAIVTAKAQTTRSRILGVLTRPDAQLMMVDTPGFHDGRKKLNVALNDAVDEAARDCDVALVMVDLASGWTEAHDALIRTLHEQGKAIVLAGNKCDGPSTSRTEWPPAVLPEDTPCARISARTGEGVAELLELLIAALPESPPLYDAEMLTDRPTRWLCGEFVREAAFEYLQRELPYSLAVEVLRFDESRADLITIHANVLVERDSQKRIVVGRGGEMIKRIGTRARRSIERLLGVRVHLELFVKVDPRWLESERRIESLGYF